MRPIDTIRNKIDSDLTKYHSSNLCKIVSNNDVKDIWGIGWCALVTRFDSYSENLESTDVSAIKYSADEIFPVILINRPVGWMESNPADKYYVLTLSPIEDRTFLSVGFLVSKTKLDDLLAYKNKKLDEISEERRKRDLEAISKDNMTTTA